MTRVEWQQLAERLLVDAKNLLDGHRWSAAYYLAGYAVECGLKACILVRLIATTEVLFEDRRFSEKCWTHALLDLVKLAGLESIRAQDATANQAFGKNWELVKDWSESSRYKATTFQKAKKFHDAITHKKDGVMPWIRARW